MNNLFQKLKIIIVLLLALLLTNTLSKTVFLANTPRIDKAFFTNLKTLPNNFIASLSRKPANTIKKFESLPITALKPMTEGVYAAEDETGKIVYIRVTKDVEYEEKIINYEGKKIKVRFPKGTFK